MCRAIFLILKEGARKAALRLVLLLVATGAGGEYLHCARKWAPGVANIYAIGELESDEDKTFNVMADETPMGKPFVRTRLVDIRLNCSLVVLCAETAQRQKPS